MYVFPLSFHTKQTAINFYNRWRKMFWSMGAKSYNNVAWHISYLAESALFQSGTGAMPPCFF